MSIVQAGPAHLERHAGAFVELMYATGPATYDYQFGERALFDRIVAASWRSPGTLFAYDGGSRCSRPARSRATRSQGSRGGPTCAAT